MSAPLHGVMASITLLPEEKAVEVRQTEAGEWPRQRCFTSHSLCVPNQRSYQGIMFIPAIICVLRQRKGFQMDQPVDLCEVKLSFSVDKHTAPCVFSNELYIQRQSFHQLHSTKEAKVWRAVSILFHQAAQIISSRLVNHCSAPTEGCHLGHYCIYYGLLL